MLKYPKLLAASLVLLSAAAFCGNASAWWGLHGFGGCCAPSCCPITTCSPCCDPCISTCDPCASYGMFGLRPAPIRRLLFGHHYAVAWGWRGGYSGWGGDCCGYGGYGGGYAFADCGCGGGCSSCGGGGGYIGGEASYDDGSSMYSAPVSPTPATRKSSLVEPSPVGDSTMRMQRTPSIYQTSYSKPHQPDSLQNSQKPDNSGVVTIYVPQDAKVFVNGKETSQTGSRRVFASFGLEKGYEYDYTITAVVVRDKERIEETKTVTLQAGDNRGVAFAFERLNIVPDEDDLALTY